MCLRGEVMLKGVEGGELPPFHLTSPLFSFITNVNADNKASFAYHNPHLSTFWSGVLGSTAVFFQKEKKIESYRGKNSAHFESCLKFSARVQITLKHVHGIEWLICIKKKKGGGMEGWKEVREGRLRELSGASKAKILWISWHYTCRGARPFCIQSFNLNMMC